MNPETMWQIHREQMRLECLRLAIQGCEGHSPKVIVDRASEMMNFIKGDVTSAAG